MNTIIPGMLMRDGEAVAPFGVMGGHYQVMGHVELLSGIIDRGLDVQEALDVPRSFGHDGVLDLEQPFAGQLDIRPGGGALVFGPPTPRVAIPVTVHSLGAQRSEE